MISSLSVNFPISLNYNFIWNLLVFKLVIRYMKSRSTYNDACFKLLLTSEIVDLTREIDCWCNVGFLFIFDGRHSIVHSMCGIHTNMNMQSRSRTPFYISVNLVMRLCWYFPKFTYFHIQAYDAHSFYCSPLVRELLCTVCFHLCH
jgi:hypothetical protein